jgi:alkylated DNA repair dioxygenase AlkB
VATQLDLTQLDLSGVWSGATPAIDPAFRGLVRRELGAGAWIDYAPAWLAGHAELFAIVQHGLRWQATTQVLYDREVATPRLDATLEDAIGDLPLLGTIGALLSARYEVDFDRISFAFYRDGEDSVAWHRDRIYRQREEGVVATVSLGGRRTFLLRPRGGGSPSVRLQLGWGDLLVMGGSCQRTWEHAVPKARWAEPRIAIMFRH